MRFEFSIIIIFLIFQAFSLSIISVTTAAEGDKDTPKTAIIGSNTGNIISNSAGGRYFFNFSIESDKSYNFQLTGDSDTKFDIYLFDSSFYPTIILDESAEYVDTSSYPVKLEGYSTTNSWAYIQIFSNHIDGGIGEFTLSISEVSSQISSSSTLANSSSETSDDSDSPSFAIILASFTIIIATITLNFKRNKFGK